MKRMIARVFKMFLPLAAVLALGACGGGGGDATGQLEVGLTDAAADYQEVVVTIKEVLAVPAGDEGHDTGLPVVASFPEGKVVDVLTLQFKQEVLGEATVPAGDYSQIRLVLADGDANYIRFNDGTTEPIKTPGSQQSGLKINGDFQVGAGESTAILLDFDPNWAVVETGVGSGKYVFKPTGIRVVRAEDLNEAFGAITGVVTDGNQEPVREAVVSAITAEGIVAASTRVISDPELENIGTYRLFLPPGEVYDIRVVAPGYEEFTTAAPYGVIEGQDATADIELIPVAEEAPVGEEEAPTAE